MSIQLNYNVGKAARPGANVFSQPVTQDVSGLQRAGQSIAKIGQSVGKIAEVYDAQDKSAQNLLGMKAYSALSEDLNQKAVDLEAAIANGDKDLVAQAQGEFNALKDKTILDYVPQDSAGVELTRDSVLTNYGMQQKQLYGSLERKLTKQKAAQYSKNVIIEETRSQESDLVSLNAQYGDNPIPLNKVQEYTNKHFNVAEDTEAYNGLVTDQLKQGYAENKLELFKTLLTKSLAGAKNQFDLDSVKLYYDVLFARYDVFRNIPGSEEDYNALIQTAQENFTANKNELEKQGAERDLGILSNSLDTAFKSESLPTNNTAMLLIDQAAAAVQTGVPKVDYTTLQDAVILQDFFTVDADNYLSSKFTTLLKTMVRTPADSRPDASQYFGKEVLDSDGNPVLDENGEPVLGLVFPELLQISSGRKTKLENHINKFVQRFDTLMEEGSGLLAMASIDPYVSKLVQDGKVAEANLYIQNEYVNKGVFRNRNFPAFFADIQTEGFTNTTKVTAIKQEVERLISRNQGNFEALANNIGTVQAKGNLTEPVANMYTLLEAVLPYVMENGYNKVGVDGLINDFIEPQRLYEAGTNTDKAKVDNIFNTLADHQISYHKEEAGDSLFGEHGLRKEIQLMNLHAEGSAAEKQFAENLVKGYLYQEMIVNKKSAKDAVESLQKMEQEKLIQMSPTIIETFGTTFSVSLPSEADDIILKGVGENQFTGFREFWYSVTGNQEELERSKRAEVARNYAMTTIALYAMSGMDVSQFQAYLKDFGLERDFDVTDPVFWNSKTGMPTRQGLESIIRGIMSNTDNDQNIAKLTGHSYKYVNGELKKFPRLAFKSGTGYTTVDTPTIFDTNDVLDFVKFVNLGDNVIYDLRFPNGRGPEAMDRLLDILEESGAIGDVPLEQILGRSYSTDYGL